MSKIKEWRRLNARSLNDRARVRYENDPEYREAVRRLKAKTGRGSVDRRARLESHLSTVDIEVDGVMVPMLSLNSLAKALNKNLSTVRVWEREGIVPDTPYRSKKGKKLYPVEVLEKIRKKLRSKGKVKISPKRGAKSARSVDLTVELATGEIKKIRLYYIKFLALTLGIRSSHILTMEHDEHLPRTPFRYTSKEFRLYTLPMIESVRHAYNEFQKSSKQIYDWARLFDSVELQWIKQGIIRRTSNAPDARILEGR